MSKLDHDALTERQLELLEAWARELEMPNWENIPPLALLAKVAATTRRAAHLAAEHPDWSRTRCLDEAEACVMELPARGKAVSSTIARWLRDE